MTKKVIYDKTQDRRVRDSEHVDKGNREELEDVEKEKILPIKRVGEEYKGHWIIADNAYYNFKTYVYFLEDKNAVLLYELLREDRPGFQEHDFMLPFVKRTRQRLTLFTSEETNGELEKRILEILEC